MERWHKDDRHCRYQLNEAFLILQTIITNMGIHDCSLQGKVDNEIMSVQFARLASSLVHYRKSHVQCPKHHLPALIRHVNISFSFISRHLGAHSFLNHDCHLSHSPSMFSSVYLYFCIHPYSYLVESIPRKKARFFKTHKKKLRLLNHFYIDNSK